MHALCTFNTCIIYNAATDHENVTEIVILCKVDQYSHRNPKHATNEDLPPTVCMKDWNSSYDNSTS
jgi:hypothetical protein